MNRHVLSHLFQTFTLFLNFDHSYVSRTQQTILYGPRIGQTQGFLDTSTEFIMVPSNLDQSFLIPTGSSPTREEKLRHFIFDQQEDWCTSVNEFMISLQLTFKNENDEDVVMIIDKEHLFVPTFYDQRRCECRIRLQEGIDQWRFGIAFLKKVYVEMTSSRTEGGDEKVEIALFEKTSQ